MNYMNKFITILVTLVMTVVSFGAVSVLAEDTSGAVISELGNSSAITGLEYSTSDAYEGERAIHITKGGEMTTPTKLGLTQNSYYNISFMIKGTLTTSNGMYLRMGWGYTTNAAKIKGDANGVFVVPTGTGEGILKITEDNGGWYKVESTTPWKCSEMNIGFFNVQSSGGTVDFYIDNLSITESESGQKMVENGGFEEITEPTPPPLPPEPSGEDTVGATITEFGNTETIAGLEYSTIDAYEGERAIHITKGGEMTTPTKLGLTSGETYNISFMIKGTLTTSNGMYLRMGWGYTSNAAKIKSDNNGVFSVESGAGDGILKVTADSDGWYKVESIIPWTCSEMNIGFFNVQSGGGTSDFYIDNLSIVDSKTGAEMVENGGFEPPAVEIGDFEVTTSPEGKQVVSVTIKNNSAGSNIGAILILTTAKDKIMQEKATDFEIAIAEETETTLEAEITVNDGETLTVYLWDSLGGKMPWKDAEIIKIVNN